MIAPQPTPVPAAARQADVAAPPQAPSPKADLPQTAAPAREPVLDAPVRASFLPAPAPDAGTDGSAEIPATDRAVIIFSNIPGSNCGACEKVKISVAPSGKVLIERIYLSGEWHYKRQITTVLQENAAAFAARLNAYRLPADQARASAPACAESDARDDGVAVEWIESGRRDRFTFTFGCAARRNSPLAEFLRHAPDVLALPPVVFPWVTAP